MNVATGRDARTAREDPTGQLRRRHPLRLRLQHRFLPLRHPPPFLLLRPPLLVLQLLLLVLRRRLRRPFLRRRPRLPRRSPPDRPRIKSARRKLWVRAKARSKVVAMPRLPRSRPAVTKGTRRVTAKVMINENGTSKNATTTTAIKKAITAAKKRAP